jgi:N-methylhydantoinase B
MRSAVVVALSYLIDPDTPKNDGTFRPITVIAKPGTIVWANPGMPVTLATNHCGQEIMEAIVKALAQACPDRAMAGWGRRFRIAGPGPRRARRRRSRGWRSPVRQAVHLAFLPGVAQRRRLAERRRLAGRRRVAGGGRHQVRQPRSDRDAFPVVPSPPRIPPRFVRRRKIPRGPGGIVEMDVETAEPAVANTAGDCVRHGACGIAGDADGAPHRYTLYSDGRSPRPIKTKETGLVIRPGDVLVLESGGGGGWNDPAERDPAAIASDRDNDFISAPAKPAKSGE